MLDNRRDAGRCIDVIYFMTLWYNCGLWSKPKAFQVCSDLRSMLNSKFAIMSIINTGQVCTIERNAMLLVSRFKEIVL